MSAPKHLWSGDWQRESEEASNELSALRSRSNTPEASPPPEPARPRSSRPGPARPGPSRPDPSRLGPSRPVSPRPGTPRPGSPPGGARRPPWAALHLSPRVRRVLPVALAVLLIIAAGAYGLTRALGPSSDSTASTPLSQSGAPMNWLGMQIGSVTPGTVVVQTVAPGSPAELAGLEPGDVINQVNFRPISSTADIVSAVASVSQGAYVPIEVSRGSTPVTARALFAGPPTSHP